MKKHFSILLTACMLCALSTMGQGKKGLPQWELEVEIAPSTYQYDADIPESTYSGFQVNGKKLNGDIAIHSWRKVASKLQLGSGLRYSVKDPGVQYYCHVCLFAAIPPNNRETLRYAEVPVSARYFPFSALGLYLEGSVSAQVKVAASENGNLIGLLQPLFPDFMLGTRAGVGYRISLGQKFGVHLGAGVRKDIDFDSNQQASLAAYSKVGFSVAL